MYLLLTTILLFQSPLWIFFCHTLIIKFKPKSNRQIVDLKIKTGSRNQKDCAKAQESEIAIDNDRRATAAQNLLCIFIFRKEKDNIINYIVLKMIKFSF